MSGERDECFDLFKGIYDAQHQMLEMGAETMTARAWIVTGRKERTMDKSVPKWIRFVVTHDDGFQRYCDRSIYYRNEVNGIGCEECEVAKSWNLEDDDSPCLDCDGTKGENDG